MKIEVIAIGDAHRTGGDSRDIFSYRPYSASALGRLMGETFPARPRCVRLGDWYDYWLGRGSRVNGCGNGAEFIFNLDRDIILAGNHDPGMGQEQAMLVIGGRKFLFIHGQRFDPWNSGVRRWIGWLATRAAGRVMDFYGSPMRPTGEQVNEWLLRLLGRSNDHSAFEAAAVAAGAAPLAP